MKTSITAIEQAAPNTPLVLRGDFSESIRTAARLGYDGSELHILDPGEVDGIRIQKALRENHIEVTSIGTGPSYTQQRVFMTHKQPEVREEALRRMEGMIRFGEEFGAAVIIGLMKGQKKDCGDPKKYMEYFQESMEICLKMAEKRKVLLVMEVIDRFESDWLNTVDEGLELLAQYSSDYLKLHLDTFHMNIEEPDCAVSILKAGRHIGHVHVADSDRWYPGHAHYDFDATFAALKKTGYDGAVALESFCYPAPEEAAKRNLNKMREYW